MNCGNVTGAASEASERFTSMKPRKLSYWVIALLSEWGQQHLHSLRVTFMKAKRSEFIVGFPAGSGYDLYTRTIARHMGKHIPGYPTMAVENMSGAGSMIAANNVFKVAKPDGLIIGHFIGGLFLQQILGKPGIEFDAAKFEFIGAPAQDNFIIGVHKSTGIVDLEKWLASKQIVKFGGVASGRAATTCPTS